VKSGDELRGLEVTSLIAHDERKRARENMASLLHEGVRRNTEYTLLRKDGTRFPGELSSAVVRDSSGRPRALIAVIRDITERKQAQEALERERRTLLHMLRASDHERQTIAYDIHDGLAQQLAGATMQFQVYEHLKDHAASKAKTAYDAGVELVQRAHAEARRLIGGVRPPALDEAGVAVAISHLVHEQRERKGPQIEYHDAVEFDRLPPILENAIYRIVHEALTNACQHSGSEKVDVSLLQEGDLLRLEVQDWGVGFDPEAVDEDRFGLEGIKERTRLLGGECSIESEPGEGTCVRVVLPILEEE
jgi:signal transduction histidine kinase